MNDWTPPPFPTHETLAGSRCALEPLDSKRHGPGLFEAFGTADLWTYMSWGPFGTVAELENMVNWISDQADWLGYAVVVDGDPAGISCYLRIDPANGAIEVGGITYSPALQRTAAATEAMFLMADHAFEMGYRRYEWKCDDLNQASRRAAVRLGFSYEGTFRQATIYKGRNRDTAWYSITDKEWPVFRREYLRWLDSSNFDEEGRQLSRLAIREDPAP